ncbi:MAG: YceD family protein [Myxococcales bacterium]|nr:YceD family protein [Myxococcales bacterium]
MAHFSIDLLELSPVARPYAFDVGSAYLLEALEGTGLQPSPGAPGSLDLEAQRRGSEVLVRGRLAVDVLAECARCLEPARVAVRTDLIALFVPAGADRAVRDDDDIDVETYRGEQIGLDALVREHILVEIPMQPLCRPDCPGIEMPAHVRAPGLRDVDERIGVSAASSAVPDPRVTRKES